MNDLILQCDVCPHRCKLKPNTTGRCRARKHIIDDTGNKIIPVNYGMITSLALDPIEKKPLKHFYPGSYILSAGSFGCNLNCPFCQNHEISASNGADLTPANNYLSVEELINLAIKSKAQGNIGIAFTYNEPLIGYEYVIDVAKSARTNGLKTVLVTAGCVNEPIADRVLPYIDALNIDLKSYNKNIYSDTLGGDLDTVKAFISKAANTCHVELTTLIVPGMNDSAKEMSEICRFTTSLPGGKNIPLHITRFFPRYRMTDKKPTDISLILSLTELAGKYMNYVYPGNI
ncbi:MAG: AmmeMemoRadiSam system radical SAM enzyme [Lachnospiraceae bacterium]|nr:AmmeMemoRadiSam system radical SAM enzyme [Lachnospiraceae bacterium]